VHKSIPVAMTSLGLAGALAAPTSALAASGTFKGAPGAMKWGPVQVTITVSGTRITNISSTYPKERPRSAFINNKATAILRSEALSAQSYHIHSLSGATMTSTAFMNSLYSAMHQAHLA
jgi:uncharacterized protein with FMN-binding domain